MGLRDEIEKIIAKEREKLQEDDRHEDEFRTQQCQRFQPMGALLQELVTSVGAEHLKAIIQDEIAVLRLGKIEAGSSYFETDVTWWIEPNAEFDVGGDSLKHREAPGFCIKETVYNRLPSYVMRRLQDFDVGETTERHYTFDTAANAAQHLVEKIASKLAWYRHLDDTTELD